jgi:hypothetical protein
MPAAAYDAAVLARLDGVHERVVPLIEAAATQLPRLSAHRGNCATS